MTETVVVAMSGGVDSSVAAALLKQQGYTVIGMMMRLWSESGREADNRCCTPDDMAQARRVAALLGIPFYAVDAQQPFHDSVVTYFIQSYLQGDTPNPCLACNRYIRWEFLLKRALAIGADYMATGHYVRLSRDEDGTTHLYQAHDRHKDQSYVLHVLGQAQLRHALFPLGDFTKPEIRELARHYNLPVAERPDSQDLCFLGDEDYRDFLRRNAPQSVQPGPILTQNGQQLGQHDGLAFYTIGQRKGLGLSGGQVYYVLAKDMAGNALIVGAADELGRHGLLAGPVNWLSGAPPPGPFAAQVKIRYKAALAPAVVTPLDGGRAQVAFEQPLRDITSGQAAVFYQDNECLGGGLILP